LRPHLGPKFPPKGQRETFSRPKRKGGNPPGGKLEKLNRGVINQGKREKNKGGKKTKKGGKINIPKPI